jgi:DNA helicase-2/ATP-dependent DNA helicase PcrA
VLSNPGDSLGLKRIINTPSRGVGSATIEAIESVAAEKGIPLYEAFVEAIERGAINKPEAKKFFDTLEKVKNRPAAPHEIATTLLEETGYIGMWEREETEEAYARIENIRELISAIKDYEDSAETPTIEGFLEKVTLSSDMDSFDSFSDAVTLMTLHSAKGLEFPVVFIVGLEEGLLPHARSAEGDALEEERRLFYVGITRAKEKLHLLSVRTRTLYGEERYRTLSRFVDEIEEEFLKRDKSDSAVYTLDEAQTCHYGYENASDPFRVGMKVLHREFGVGTVRKKEGAGENAKLTVLFRSNGVKLINARFLSPFF